MRTHSIGQNLVVYKHSFKSIEPEKRSSVYVSEPNESTEDVTKKRRNEKVLPIVTAAVAVASLGVAGYALTRGRGKSKPIESAEEKATGAAKDAINETKKAVEDVKKDLQGKIDDLSNRLKNTENQSGRVDEAVNKVNDLAGKVNGIKDEAQKALNETANKKHNFSTRAVNINGMNLQLASVMHGYGKREAALKETLQTESAKRLLGAAPIVAALPALTTVRFMSAEYDGFAKTGGMAIVPKELLANIGAIVNDKQDVELLVDTPLYRGSVTNDTSFELENIGNGRYRYLSISPNETKVMAELEDMGTMPLEIYGDEKTTENVRIFRSNTLTAKVDFNKTMQQLSPETAAAVNEALAKGKSYEVGPLLFKPEKEINTVNLSLNNGQTVSIAYESFTKLLTDEAANIADRFMAANQSVEYKNIEDMMKKYRESAEIERLKNENVDPSTWKEHLEKISKQPVKIIKDGVNGSDFVGLSTNEDDAAKLREFFSSASDKTLPKFKLLPKSPQSVVVRYKTVFYDNRRFKLDSPYDVDRDKDIYTNTTLEAGETERFISFAKFFYEHLLPENNVHLKEPLKADIVIGNDWHTGPAAAMARLLTPAKEAFGLRKDIANKIQNIPFITVMHNFRLNGAANHSQEKLLNLMFGAHAAMIAENAYAPIDSKLPPHLWNGLMSYNSVNPQTMAMNYSDYITFVSEGNFKEASEEAARGGVNHELASLRGHKHQYSNKELREKMAMKNGIKPEEMSQTPTANGITNGCDRVNNIVTPEKARFLELHLDLPEGSLMSDVDVERLNNEGKNGAYIVHQNNKKVQLKRLIDDINIARDTKGAINPMKLSAFESTDLTGVDENTLIIGMAGRIVDQKGIDILTGGILEYYKNHEYDKENPPVFYLQGTGDKTFIEGFLNTKKEVAKINKKAADRMIFAGLFKETGRYDAFKMFSDFSDMPSWDEPCGLVHKEIAYTSGAIPIVNCTGGLRDGLRQYGVDKNPNAIFVDFKDKFNHDIKEALPYNSKNFGNAFATAVTWYSNKKEFEDGIKSSYEGDYDWLTGKIQQYVEILQNRGALSKDINTNKS